MARRSIRGAGSCRSRRISFRHLLPCVVDTPTPSSVVDVVELLMLLNFFIFFFASFFVVFFGAHSLQSFGVPLRKEGVLMFSVVKERPYSASSAFSASSSAASFTGVEVHVLALELGVSDDAAGEEACRQHRTCDRRNDFLLFHELCLSWLMMRVLSSTEREDRGWSMEKVRDRVVKGEMKYVLTGPNEAVFFERASDKENSGTRGSDGSGSMNGMRGIWLSWLACRIGTMS